MYEDRARAVRSVQAYEVVQEQELKDVGSLGILLSHKKTGARVALIINDDDNKVFDIAFRTPVTDSTGVPHIIEHSVLCGSEKYPVKDPFTELGKSSLYTFLNAMTYGDKTMYPVASCNDKDFKNLMGVYMDAALKPLIYERPEIFRQEGIRFDIDDAGNLIYNGVVYNEMKGAMSSPERVIYQKGEEALFPDITYGFNSGGDPEVIRTLTYEKFLEFHGKYYHPSNSYIMLYGNFDPKERLEWMDENYLSGFDRLEVDSEVKLQDPKRCIKEMTAEYPLGSGEDDTNKAYIGIGMVVGNEKTTLRNVAASVLLNALVSKPGAPVWEAVMASGICEDFQSMFMTDVRQPYMSMFARNADPARKEELLGIIRKAVEDELKKGLNKRSLLAIINRGEFTFLEADSGTTPKGLVYFDSMLSTWLYDDDLAFDSFNYCDICRQMREGLETGLFEQLAKELFLEPEHSSVVVLLPKKGLGEEKDAKLAKELADKKAAMSEAELKEIEAISERQKEYRDTPDTKENLATIPVLERKDLTREVRSMSNIEKSVKGRPVYLHDYSGNGIIYSKFIFDLGGIKEDEISYAALLEALLTQVNTRNYKYAELDDEISLLSGGLNTTVTAYVKYDNGDEYRPYCGIGMRMKKEKTAELFALISEILNNSLFDDKKHIYDVLNMLRSNLEYRLANAGHATALKRVTMGMMKSAVYVEKTSGIDFYRFVDGIINDYDNRFEELSNTMKKLSKELFTAENLTVSVTCTAEEYEGFAKALEGFVDTLAPSGRFGLGKGLPELELVAENEAFYNASQVTYTAEAVFGGKAFAKGTAKVLGTILNNDWLYPMIRVKGGAYGAFGRFFSYNGGIGFATYRDPKIAESIETFNGTPGFLEGFKADEDEMTKFIIGTMGGEQTPSNARLLGVRSMENYFSGATIELLQKTRDELLATTAEDIRAFAPEFAKALKDTRICTVGSEIIIRENADRFDKIEQLQRK